MIKIILACFIPGTLVMGTVGNPSINLSIPEYASNVYPDSFALHWTIRKSFAYLKKGKEMPEVAIEITIHLAMSSIKVSPMTQ
jgi:hypothetical protein